MGHLDGEAIFPTGDPVSSVFGSGVNFLQVDAGGERKTWIVRQGECNHKGIVPLPLSEFNKHGW